MVPETLAMSALISGYYGAHAIVHLEERYIMILFPVVLLIFANILQSNLAIPGLLRSLHARLFDRRQFSLKSEP
jgi:hypothetical protein